MTLENKKNSGFGPQWRWPHALTNLFIAFFLYVSIVQIMPNGSCRRFLLSPVIPLVEALGLWQNFVTFGPEPPKINQYLEAVVTFDDGTSCLWHYPSLDHFDSALTWMRSLRYRIFWTHHLHNEPRLYSDFASYVAGACTTGNKRPVSAKLVRRTFYTTYMDPTTGKLIDKGGPHEDIVYECSFAQRGMK
jgi:hypothetical protein